MQQRRKKFMIALGSFFALVFSLFFAPSLHKETPLEKSFQITTEERVWLREFFRDFLFDSPGVYTLFGSKPVSGSCLYRLTDTEKQAAAEYMASLTEEERKQTRIKRYDFEGNYDKWMTTKHRFNIRQYLFGEFVSPVDERTTVIFFVNIETTIKAVIANYEDFRRILGHDFNPVQCVFDVENKESLFWNTVLKNHVLMGILHGFGKENAWFFDWSMKYQDSDDKIGDFFNSLPSGFSEDENIKHQDPTNFMIPVFGSFGMHPNNKALIKKYRKEQKRIKALYQGKDEVDVALSWLTR